MIQKFLYLLLFTVFLSSCFLFRAEESHYPTSDYYNIRDTYIWLMIKHPEDTLPPPYPNETPHPCKKLETTSQFDTTKRLGVAIRFWETNQANANYGPYKKGGLIEKIKTIDIWFANENSRKDITSELIGDSTISKNYLWTLTPQYRQGLNSVYSIGDGACYKTNYYRDIPSLIQMANSYEPMGSRIHGSDFLFWLDKSVIKSMAFKPTQLWMQVSFMDSAGTQVKTLTDWFPVN